jgi:hypothetical protein
MKYLFVIYPNKNFNVNIDLPIFYLNMKKQLQKETLLWNIPYRNKIQVYVEKCAHNSTSSYWILPDTLIR